MSESSEEKIAEIVANEAVARMEAILKEAAQQSFVLRKGDHAIADVTRREDAIFAAEAAGAAAVIRDRDDGGEIGDGALGADMIFDAPGDVLFEAAKERGKAGAAAKSDNAEAARKRIGIRSAFFHLRL